MLAASQQHLQEEERPLNHQDRSSWARRGAKILPGTHPLPIGAKDADGTHREWRLAEQETPPPTSTKEGSTRRLERSLTTNWHRKQIAGGGCMSKHYIYMVSASGGSRRTDDDKPN